jgi:hypothetical protein
MYLITWVSSEIRGMMSTSNIVVEIKAILQLNIRFVVVVPRVYR